MTTILIVDRDLGLLAFVSKALSQAGYETLPATTIESVMPLLDELENPRVDLLLVNLSLPGSADLVTTLNEQNDSMKIISVEDFSVNLSSNIPFDASLWKPAPSEVAQVDEWLRLVNQLLGDA